MRIENFHIEKITMYLKYLKFCPTEKLRSVPPGVLGIIDSAVIVSGKLKAVVLAPPQGIHRRAFIR